MRKFFGLALLNAAFVGQCGMIAAAEEYQVISLPGDVAVDESKPYEICQDDSIY